MTTETMVKIRNCCEQRGYDYGDKLLELMEQCNVHNLPDVPEEDAIRYLKNLEALRAEKTYEMPKKIIAVDFDGTLCEDKWPGIGELNPEVIDYILSEQKKGARLILWTNRTGVPLMRAILWCNRRKIWFDTVNNNLPEMIERFGGDTRKVFATEYIDDKACTKFKFPFVKAAHE